MTRKNILHENQYPTINRMDPDSLLKFVGNHGNHSIFGGWRSIGTNGGLTGSRFRRRLRFPVVEAQEASKQTVERKTSFVEAGINKAHDEETLVPSQSMKKVLQNNPTDYRALMETSANLVSKEEILDYINKETGRERLQQLFGKDVEGRRSQEMYMVIGGILQAGLFGAVVAGFIGARVAKERYVKKHYAAQFETKFFGIRGHLDAMVIGAIGFGAKWALRLSVFTGTFLLISQSVSVYRNKTGVVEYTLAGGMTGALFRMNMGLRGMFAAGILGTTFGTIAGLLAWGTSEATGESQQAKHYQYVHEQLVEKKKYKNVMEAAAKENFAYLPPSPS
ncbi:complex I assembly factor TIMMDC1, mitochondrial-like isoform X2 [Lineus longissimus]|uniref:complex I assembly factor TIMMDC1, mitochondrial-like isoform X2 n=1 Tax=Lineus longissimus TaxID=88925 RepID=UPI00315CCB87